MIFNKSIAISSAFLSAIFLAALVNCEEISGGESRETHYMGNVGNKQFFVLDGLMNWQDAAGTCRSIGMRLVTFNTSAEYAFIRHQLQVEDKGPFWLGGRCIPKISMYRWNDLPSGPDPNDPAIIIGDFVELYNWIEQGWMALQMNKAVGGSVFGANSFSASAKALCQVG